MTCGPTLPRRSFVKLCATAAAAVAARPETLAAGSDLKTYERVRLVTPGGDPVRPGSLHTGRTYVFNYPYSTTPCFLVDLGRPALPDGPLETEEGALYRWPGGIGPERSVVSFCAICAHKMSHPARAVSFINYRHDRITFRDAAERTAERSGVIYCCSERSVYDPARGARVLGGPAPQPLAAIHLEENADDGALLAGGTYGGEMYERFFEKFGFRLALEHETRDVRRLVQGESTVVPIEEYSSTTMQC